MAACLPAELLSQSGKRVLDCATVEFTATRGEKEHLRLERRRHRPVADACIIREHMRGTGVQGNHTRSSEFSFLERKQAVGEIDVATLKRQRLREAQTGSRQQPKERGIRGPAHTLCAREPCGGAE